MGWRGPEGNGAGRRRRELALLCLFLHNLADGVGNLPAWPCACCGAPGSDRASSTPAACGAPQLSLRGGAPRPAGRQRVASSPSPSSPLPSDSDAVMHEVANTGPLSQAQTTQLHALPLSELLPLCEACGIAKVGGAKAECAPAPELAYALGRLDGQRREFLKEALCELAASAPPKTADIPAREQAEASRRASPRRPAATKPVAAGGREQKASGPKPASALKPGFLLQGSTRHTRGAGAGGGAADAPVVGESDVSDRKHSAVQRPGRIHQARASSRVRGKMPHSAVGGPPLVVRLSSEDSTDNHDWVPKGNENDEPDDKSGRRVNELEDSVGAIEPRRKKPLAKKGGKEVRSGERGSWPKYCQHARGCVKFPVFGEYWDKIPRFCLEHRCVIHARAPCVRACVRAYVRASVRAGVRAGVVRVLGGCLHISTHVYTQTRPPYQRPQRVQTHLHGAGHQRCACDRSAKALRPSHKPKP